MYITYNIGFDIHMNIANFYKVGVIIRVCGYFQDLKLYVFLLNIHLIFITFIGLQWCYTFANTLRALMLALID